MTLKYKKSLLIIERKKMIIFNLSQLQTIFNELRKPVSLYDSGVL